MTVSFKRWWCFSWKWISPGKGLVCLRTFLWKVLGQVPIRLCTHYVETFWNQSFDSEKWVQSEMGMRKFSHRQKKHRSSDRQIKITTGCVAKTVGHTETVRSSRLWRDYNWRWVTVPIFVQISNGFWQSLDMVMMMQPPSISSIRCFQHWRRRVRDCTPKGEPTIQCPHGQFHVS
jgi:hypothetical protein